nr:hypothetical protein [Tanacetum cinerariifolium]
TPGVFVSKKKAPAKADRIKCIEILSGVALSEAGVPDEQQRKTTGTDEGTGTKPGVPDVPSYKSNSDNESWGDSEDESDDHDDDSKGDDDDKADSDDDGNSDADDNERTDLDDDDDENPSFNLKDYNEEEHDEEYESDDDYENVFKEEDVDLYKDMYVRSLGAKPEKERECDEEMTDVDHNVSQEKSYEQVIKDAHEESSTQVPSLSTLPEMAIPETSTTYATIAKSSSQPKSIYEVVESLTEFELKKILLEKMKRSESYKTASEHKELNEGLVKSYNLEKYLFSSYEPMSTLIEFSAYVMHNLKIDNLTQEILVGPTFNLLKGTCKSFVKLEYHFEECYKAVTDQLDWNNPTCHEYSFDLSKPLPLIEAQSR